MAQTPTRIRGSVAGATRSIASCSLRLLIAPAVALTRANGENEYMAKDTCSRKSFHHKSEAAVSETEHWSNQTMGGLLEDTMKMVKGEGLSYR
jgi:hypothetical protein